MIRFVCGDGPFNAVDAHGLLEFQFELPLKLYHAVQASCIHTVVVDSLFTFAF